MTSTQNFRPEHLVAALDASGAGACHARAVPEHRWTKEEIIARQHELARRFETGDLTAEQEIHPGDPGWDEYLAKVAEPPE